MYLQFCSFCWKCLFFSFLQTPWDSCYWKIFSLNKRIVERQENQVFWHFHEKWIQHEVKTVTSFFSLHMCVSHVCAYSLPVIRPRLSLPPPCMSQSCSTVWEGLGSDTLLVARPHRPRVCTHTYNPFYIFILLWKTYRIPKFQSVTGKKKKKKKAPQVSIKTDAQDHTITQA